MHAFANLFFFCISVTLQEFSSFLPAEDAALVAGFAASHEGFTLPLTVPQLYRQMAYQSFAVVWRFLTSHSVLELLTDHRESVASYLQSLICFGFKGPWFEKMSTLLQQPAPTGSSVELEKLLAEEDMAAAHVTKLQGEVSQLSERLSAVRSLLEGTQADLASLVARRKAVEQAQDALKVPFSL